LYLQAQEHYLVAGILFCNEYNLLVPTSEQNVVGMLKARKVDRHVVGEECKALFVESDSFKAFLDSGLLQDMTSERL
jgi:hypothetical protein